MSQKYPAGTKFCDSMYPDVATDEVVDGFQVFEQLDPQGKTTGRKTVLGFVGDDRPQLYSIGIARQLRQDKIRDNADYMMATLLTIEKEAKNGKIRELAKQALDRALGIR